MRAEPVLALAAVLSGCAWSLDEPAPLEAPPIDAAVPTPPTCPMLADPARGVTGARGRARTVRWPDGSLRLVADSLETRDGGGDHSVGPAVLTLGGPAPDPATCLRDASPPPPFSGPALDLGPLGAGAGRLLGVAVIAGRPVALIETTSLLDRIGIAAAAWDDARAAFVAEPRYLFTGDRALFGDSLLVEDGYLYAYGCRSVGFLRDACYLARVPEDRYADPTAYRFYRAGGSYGPDLEDAWPLFDGGGGLAVVHLGARYYAIYADPLADSLTARSGLGPSGPWSAPFPVARCGLPRAGAFCGVVAAHPELAAAPGRLWVSHAVSSFDPLSPDEAATRLVEISLDGLP